MRYQFGTVSRAVTVVLTAVALAAGAGTALAAPSFEGRQVTMIIGYKPGGGTDAIGRLMGEYLAKHLPGGPSIVYRNMPGGGGITAMNYFARQVEPDGLTIATTGNQTPNPLRWRAQSSHYDPTTFRFIGGVAGTSKLLIISKDAMSRLTDKSQPPVIMGAVDGSRSGMQMMLWGIEHLDWNAKWVTGYPGTAELILALRRGEIDVTSEVNAFSIRELLSTGKYTALVQSGTPEGGRLMSRSGFGDVPILSDLIRSKLKSERERQAFDYWEGVDASDKGFALPEGTPDEIVQVYRAAFRQAAKDTDFIARGKKLISEDFRLAAAEDQEKLVRQVALAPEDALDYIDELKRKQGLPVAKR